MDIPLARRCNGRRESPENLLVDILSQKARMIGRGQAHRYFFKLYALDTMLDLKPGARKPDLIRAMEKHILGQTQCMGTYRRQ